MKRPILILARASVLASALALPLAGCGVKSDLLKPNGHATPASENDPSKPPQPLGR